MALSLQEAYRARSQPPQQVQHGPALAPNCQYFALTPRPSIESPVRPNDCDENEPPDVNARRSCVRNIAQDFGKPSKSKLSRPPSGERKGLANSHSSAPALQPCLRPATPPRKLKKLDETCLSTSRVHESGSVGGLSVQTEDNEQESRLARLARRTPQRSLSSKELELRMIETRKQDQKELVRQNELNRRKAMAAGDLATAGRTSKPSKVTTPREFNLSSAPTPCRTRSAAPSIGTPESSIGTSIEDGNLSVSQSSQRSQSGQGPRQTWKPVLTVPKAPELRTPGRGASRSQSRDRKDGQENSVSSRPASTERTTTCSAPASRPATPERRRRLDVYPIAARLERHSAIAANARTTRAQHAADKKDVEEMSSHTTGNVTMGCSAQERAQLARLAVQKRKEEEARVTQEKLCIFKKPTTAVAKELVDGELSMRSARSVRGGSTPRQQSRHRPATSRANLS